MLNDFIFTKLFIVGTALTIMMLIVGTIYGLSFLGHIVIALEVILLLSAIMFIVKIIFDKIDEAKPKKE